MTKHVFSETEWMRKLSQIKISQQKMDQLVLEWLYTNGYSDAAKQFKKEVNIDNAVISPLLAERQYLRNLVSAGDVDGILNQMTATDPYFAISAPKIAFHILLLKFFEFDDSQLEDAIKFTRTELKSCIDMDESLKDELAAAMFFKINPEKLTLSIEDYKENLSDELNDHLLKLSKWPRTSTLDHSVRFLLKAQEQLKKVADFPILDINGMFCMPDTTEDMANSESQSE